MYTYSLLGNFFYLNALPWHKCTYTKHHLCNPFLIFTIIVLPIFFLTETSVCLICRSSDRTLLEVTMAIIQLVTFSLLTRNIPVRESKISLQLNTKCKDMRGMNCYCMPLLPQVCVIKNHRMTDVLGPLKVILSNPPRAGCPGPCTGSF